MNPKLQEAIDLLRKAGWHGEADRLEAGTNSPRLVAYGMRDRLRDRERNPDESKALSILDELSSPVSEPKPAEDPARRLANGLRGLAGEYEHDAKGYRGERAAFLRGEAQGLVTAAECVESDISAPVSNPPEGQGEALPEQIAIARAKGIAEGEEGRTPLYGPSKAPPGTPEPPVVVAYREGYRIGQIRTALGAIVSRAIVDRAQRLEVALSVAALAIEHGAPPRKVADLIKGFPCHPDTGERSILDQALHLLRGST